MKSNAALDLATTGPTAGAPVVPGDISLIGHVEVALTAQVGTVTLSVERLFGLKAGDTVQMDELLETPLTLMLNGRPVARGELLAIDDHFGVRILELA